MKSYVAHRDEITVREHCNYGNSRQRLNVLYRTMIPTVHARAHIPHFHADLQTAGIWSISIVFNRHKSLLEVREGKKSMLSVSSLCRFLCRIFHLRLTQSLARLISKFFSLVFITQLSGNFRISSTKKKWLGGRSFKQNCWNTINSSTGRII